MDKPSFQRVFAFLVFHLKNLSRFRLQQQINRHGLRFDRPGSNQRAATIPDFAFGHFVDINLGTMIGRHSLNN